MMGAWTWSMRVCARSVSCMLCRTGRLTYSSLVNVTSFTCGGDPTSSKPLGPHPQRSWLKAPAAAAQRLRASQRLKAAAAGVLAAALLVRAGGLTAAGAIPSPEQFIGFRVGADNKLARWD